MNNKPLALIVEDDVDLAAIFAEAFGAAGYETMVTYDGEAALAVLADHLPLVVLLDMHLPKLSGEGVLRHIREDARLARTRVIIATADGTTTVGYPAEKANIVLVKPVRFQQLRHLAARLYPAGE